MKANEVPEKIYVASATFPDYIDFDGSPINTKRIDNHDIEYIRADVFIEKVCEFLSKEANIPLWEGYNGDFGCDTELLIKNVKNYMKGE